LPKKSWHCWNHFLNSSHELAFSTVVVFFMFSISWNLHPFKADFIFGNSQNSFRAKSGKQGGCSISVINFWARNCLT
jgi:hypothetical protein